MSDPLHKIHKTTKGKQSGCGSLVSTVAFTSKIAVADGFSSLLVSSVLTQKISMCFIGKIAYEWSEIGDFPLPCQIARTYLLGLLGTKDPINILKIVIWGQCGQIILHAVVKKNDRNHYNHRYSSRMLLFYLCRRLDWCTPFENGKPLAAQPLRPGKGVPAKSVMTPGST